MIHNLDDFDECDSLDQMLLFRESSQNNNLSIFLVSRQRLHRTLRSKIVSSHERLKGIYLLSKRTQEILGARILVLYVRLN